jgi:hypothetical protein
VNGSLPTRAFREHTDLAQLKRQAKELLEAFRAGEAAATSEVNAHYRDADRNTFALHDAQLVIAGHMGSRAGPSSRHSSTASMRSNSSAPYGRATSNASKPCSAAVPNWSTWTWEETSVARFTAPW